MCNILTSEKEKHGCAQIKLNSCLIITEIRNQKSLIIIYFIYLKATSHLQQHLHIYAHSQGPSLNSYIVVTKRLMVTNETNVKGL